MVDTSPNPPDDRPEPPGERTTMPREIRKDTLAAFGASDYRHRRFEPGSRLVGGSRMKSKRLYRCFLHLVVLLLGATNVGAESPTVHIEYQARVDETGGVPYVFAEGTMSGTVRGDATYTVPVQIHYPAEGGNGTVVLELTNSALLFFHLRDRGDRVGDRRPDADDIDELEAMQVNFGWAGGREYLLRNGFAHMAIQYSKAVTDFMGASPPEGRVRRRLCYGRIEKATDGYEIVRDAARWLAAPGALTGDAPPVPPHDHVIAYGLSGTGYFLRDYLIRGENAGGEIDGFFVHAAGSKCLAPIDDTADCPEGAICIGSPRFSHWFTCPGPPPTNGAKVLAVDAQSDLEFNDGALAREGAIDDPDYVRWEVAGAPHVPVFAMDLTRLGAPHQNPMDWSPIWRSAFHYLDRWVKDGTAPPTAPPIEGRMHATEDGDIWKCDLDADGNALGGIRLPPIEAPMGIYTGFDFSWLDPAVSKGHRYAIVFGYGGRFERFSNETLAERYPTEADYKKAFEAAARRAFDASYILEEDLRRYTDELPRDQFFDSEGVQIRYIDVGPRNGEPVVLIHGGFSSAEFWAQSGVIDALDDEYRVIALDLRGHGKSDKPHESEAYGNSFIEDVIHLLDHLAIDKAHVVGYSMGGRIAYRLVADYPERVISALPCGTDAEALSRKFHDLLLETAALLETTGSNRPLIEHFNQDGMLTGEQLQEIVETLRATNDRQAMAAVLLAFPDFVPDRSRLEANTVPCLCVIGEKDPNRAAAETTARYMGRLEVVVLEGQNHMTTFQQPEFIAAVKSFLTRHGDTSKRDPRE